MLVQFIPISYVMLVWNQLPQRLALHFNVPWTSDGMIEKTSLAWILGIIAVANIIIFTAMKRINRSKRILAPVDRTRPHDNFALAITLFITAGVVFTVANIDNYANRWQMAAIPLVGLVMAYMGNILYHLRPHYFIGIRLPWTLNSDVNWIRTHHLAGTVWFAAGIAVSLGGLLLASPILSNLFLVVALVVSVLIPISYSFILHNNYNKDEALSEQSYHQH